MLVLVFVFDAMFSLNFASCDGEFAVQLNWTFVEVI